MTTFADQLLLEQSNPIAALMEILVSEYRLYDAIAAIEGPDDRIFYYDFIRAYMAGKSVLMVDCGGKDALLSLRNLVDEYEWKKKPRLLYICDKDFDDYLNTMIDDVHYTSLYSIESYFVTEEYIRYIVDKFSKGHLGKADTDAICAEYKRRFNSMLASVRSVCALMLKTRMLGLHPDFDAISVNDLFDLAGESPVVRRNRWAVLQQNWLGPVQLAARELRKVIPTLALNDQGRWLRGKLAMQLARIALRLAVKSLPEASRGKAPDANLISAESFRYAKQFIGEMPSLAEYCAAEGAGAV